MSADLDRAIAAKGRHISLVIAGTMLAWLALNLIIGPAVGLPGRFALLFDFAALAAMVYAGVNIVQLWRMRQASKNDNQG
ncbi:DUF5337 domain-containing protein [Pseudophaeobacter flagellatus]|uniref:DUF5337 domain-containing protein n=1 Tax=Pseudophaeobacter flagellatus TaxID=2899119 RepID=UPI001E294501|nr:DUF5337 domain-containing protein [Pseudophaeobacter flagellatus]MCD9146433.1 DUF5337 domain-containing protein [Pseudophaeobacter flagellatus]